MINLDFLPSRQIALYMARLFLTRSLAVLIALVMVLMTLDLLGESSKILAVPGNGEAELWHYIGLRLPLLVSRFLPFSVLLGTLIAFTSLNQHSEVVAMKAAGLSAHQILAPMVIASLGVAVVSFVFNETVVVRASRAVSAWSNADYRPVPPESGLVTNVWLRDGDDLVHVDRVGGSAANIKLGGVTIYEREAGAIVRTLNATRADQDATGRGWVLRQVKLYDATANVVRHYPEMQALAGVDPSRLDQPASH